MTDDIVFAIFRAGIRIIDTVKRATLSRLLLDSVTSTAPGETLDEKLASLALPTDYGECQFKLNAPTFPSDLSPLYSVPPPSTDELAWWDGPGQWAFFIHFTSET